MRRIKEYIYSLLLLMVMIISSGVLSYTSYCHCHCHSSSEEVVGQHSEHHECHEVEECAGHRSSIAHRCHGESEYSLEYVVVAPQRVDNICSAVFLCVAYSLISVDGVDERASWNIAESEALYECYDPSSGALRAPPVLV